MQIFDINKDKDLIENGLYSISSLLGHADVRTTVTNYVHTADLLQKVCRDLYERDIQLYFSYDQAHCLTGYSESGLYKRFPPKSGSQSGVEARELMEIQLKQWIKLPTK